MHKCKASVPCCVHLFDSSYGRVAMFGFIPAGGTLLRFKSLPPRHATQVPLLTHSVTSREP